MSEKTGPLFQIATQDRDLGMTISLWTRDVCRAAAAAGIIDRVVVSDNRTVGTPYRHDRFRSRPVKFHARRDNRRLLLQCSTSTIFLPATGFGRVLRRLWTSLRKTTLAQGPTQLDVIRRRNLIRQIAGAAAGVSCQPSKPAFLLRIDDFPSPFQSSARFAEFHRIAAAHGIPYLLAVTPFLERRGGPATLTSDEIEILRAATESGAEVALHGFTHRSRYTNFPSELLSLGVQELRRELKVALDFLARLGFKPVAFVAPFNTYDPATVIYLAEHFGLIGGGPESIHSWGWRIGPSWFQGSLYVPSYRYAYDIDETRLWQIERLLRESDPIANPITLHWANEVSTNFRAFRALCSRLSGHVVSWTGFLERARRFDWCAGSEAPGELDVSREGG